MTSFATALNYGLDVSDRGVFSADDLMQLQADNDGAWLLASSSSGGCTLCSFTCEVTK
jgi:hypothetical protein